MNFWKKIFEIKESPKPDIAEKVKALLNDNPDLVFSKDHGGRTPLHAAAESGHKHMVELLLANGAEVNAENNDGWTPLKEAADAAAWASAYEGWYRNLDDVVQLLRQHGGHG